jgi:uncharacterized protein YuzE
MEQVKVYYDPLGNTLTIWFGNPDEEELAEEIDDNIVLMKDKDGNVIGLEKLNFAAQPNGVRVQFETLSGIEFVE